MESVKVLTAGGAANPGKSGRGKVTRRKEVNNKENNPNPSDGSDHIEAENKVHLNENGENQFSLEFEASDHDVEENETRGRNANDKLKDLSQKTSFSENELVTPVNIDELYKGSTRKRTCGIHGRCNSW